MVHRARGVATLASIVLTAFLIGPGPAQAHGWDPDWDIGHAIVVDSLWGFDSVQGTVLNINADDETAMASTTKSWTLHLAVEAVEDGFVSLSDVVTAEADTVLGSMWVPSGSSLMTDVLNTPLEVGEQVLFADLLRGMMYPSGNDAATTVGKHVARGIWGPSATVETFVNWMDFHAWSEGFTDTLFTNPAGLDGDPGGMGMGDHHTTPRDQAKWWAHALPDDLFGDVVGFQGTYSFTTSVPTRDGGPVTKSYMYSWGSSYPGWEGNKGGDTSQCSGPKEGDEPGSQYACNIISAKRLGRQVVASLMQARGGSSGPALNYGFFRIFHPDFRGQGTYTPSFRDHAVACLPANRAVSAIVTPTLATKLVTWGVDVDNFAVTKLGESALRFHPGIPGGRGPLVDVDVLRLDSGHVITATRVGSALSLRLWTIDGSGLPTQHGALEPAGSGSRIVLAPVVGRLFLSAAVGQGGGLVLDTWRVVDLKGGGIALSHLDTHTADPATSDVTAARVIAAAGFGQLRQERTYIVTVGDRPNDPFLLRTWSVEPTTGEISVVDGAGGVSSTGTAASVVQVRTVPPPGPLILGGPPSYVAMAYRSAGGSLRLGFWEITFDGDFNGAGSLNLPDQVTSTSLAPVDAGGLMVAARGADGLHRNIVVEVRRNPNDSVTPWWISQHNSSVASNIDLCELETSHAEGDYVTGNVDDDGDLRIRAWRVGDRPY